jgi:hypothetical protein
MELSPGDGITCVRGDEGPQDCIPQSDKFRRLKVVWSELFKNKEVLVFCAVSRHQYCEAKPVCFRKTIASSIATLGVFLCLAGPLSGEEGGDGDYIPGTYASLINITPNNRVSRLEPVTSFTPEASVAARHCRSVGYWPQTLGRMCL